MLRAKVYSRWDRGLKDVILILLSFWKENENYNPRKTHLEVVLLNFWFKVWWGK